MGVRHVTDLTGQADQTDQTDQSQPEAPDQNKPLRRLLRFPQRAWQWLSAHEAVPAPFDAGLAGRIALALVALIAVVYTVVMVGYVFGQQDLFRTGAEDLGIMDQVLWNTSHGHFLVQSICNNITDTNCLGNVSRFAIHFEPILIPLSLLYLIIPNVKVILFLQVAVVASGAFPAYLLAARRLRNVVWGVLFATLFLLYPSLQAAVVDDFHPETLAAAAIMWALYFLAMRRYRALVICCILTLLCKETLALDVIMIGLFVLVIQRRPRIGLSLIVAACLQLALALTLMHLASPLGQSPVAGRLDNLKSQPLTTLLSIATDPARRAYLFKLLGPVGFLPLLSPWVLALAAPSMLLNMVSSYPQMYTGIYQYNTDIVPILVAAAIDALAWLGPLLERGAASLRDHARRLLRMPSAVAWCIRPQLLLLIIVLIVFVLGKSSVQLAFHVDALVIRESFPTINQHDQIGDRIAQMIPSGASVSAQGTLAPHVSERYEVYQFPYKDYQADYVFVDVTTGNFYPYTNATDYINEVQGMLASCRFDLTAAQDGYILLHRLTPPGVAPQVCPTVLPASFYTFADVKPPSGTSPANVVYANSLQLIGYNLAPPHVNLAQPVTTVYTYWKVLRPLTQPLTVVMTFTRPDGYRIQITDAFTQTWYPPSQWPVGTIVQVVSWPLYLNQNDKGNLLFGVEVRTGAPYNNPSAQDAVPAVLPGGASPNPNGFPRLVNHGTSALLAILPVQ